MNAFSLFGFMRMLGMLPPVEGDTPPAGDGDPAEGTTPPAEGPSQKWEWVRQPTMGRTINFVFIAKSFMIVLLHSM